MLKTVCEKGYPKEVCGLLFSRIQASSGNGNDAEVRIEKIDALENILDGKHQKRLEELTRAGAVMITEDRASKGGFYEFAIDPSEHYRKTSQAFSEGLDQVGLFHSHPDHPAVPSATDASQPLLAGWSNIIVAVHQGRFKEARSWTRDGEESAFQEERILVK